MAEVDARIPLSFRPTPNIGPDFGGAIADAGSLMQLRQGQQQEQQQNALRQILGAPGAIGPMGVPTPDAISKVYGVDPGVGMKIQQQTNALGIQQANMQEHALKRHAAIQDMVDPIRTAAIRIYNDTPGSEEAKQRAARDYMLPELAKLKSGGTLTPQEADRLPTDFDIKTATANSAEWQKQLHQRQQEKIAEDRLKISDRREADAARDRGMTTNQDTDGKVFFIRPNAPPGQRMLYEDGTPVPPEKQVGVRKVGTGAGPGIKIEDVTVDGKTTQAIQEGDHWKDLDGNRITGTVRRIGKESGTDRVGLSPETINDEAERANLTGVINASYSRADRQAIQNRMTELRRAAVGGGGVSTTGDRIVSAATIKADTQSLGTLSKQSDAISAYEKGAEREFSLAQSLIPKTPEPLNMQFLTKWVRSGEKQFGDVPNAKFYTALTSALDEYAKVIGGGYGAAASTDSARNLALSLIPPGATTAQIIGVIETIKEGMEIKRQGYKDQIEVIRSRLREGQATPKPPTEERRPPPGQGGAPTPSGGPSGGVTPPQQAIDMLKADPSLAPQFDTTFGPGAARKVLGGGQAQPAPPAPAQTAPAAPAQTAPAARPAAPAPRAAAPAAIPQRPSNVPQGSMYSPSRKMWRTPDGKVLDADGKPVATP